MNNTTLLTKAMLCIATASLAGVTLIHPAAADPAKKITMYAGGSCHMLYSPAQAKKYHYVCPGSHTRMVKVTITPAAAVRGMAATSKELNALKKKRV